MKRILAPAAAAVIAACSAAPVAQADGPASPQRTLVVAGNGEASATPDMAVLSIGVETRGPSAAAALKDNAARMSAAIARLKARGIAEKDLQTQNLSVNPLYKYDASGSSPKITGYSATNTLSVKLRNLDTAGAVIDETVADGANTLGGLAFTFSDPKPLMDAARISAVEDARRRAAVLAKAAGVTLGPIFQIQDGYVSAPGPMPVYQARAAMAEAATPVAAGESTIAANVTIVYEIR